MHFNAQKLTLIANECSHSRLMVVFTLLLNLVWFAHKEICLMYASPIYIEGERDGMYKGMLSRKQLLYSKLSKLKCICFINNTLHS